MIALMFHQRRFRQLLVERREFRTDCQARADRKLVRTVTDEEPAENASLKRKSRRGWDYLQHDCVEVLFGHAGHGGQFGIAESAMKLIASKAM